MAWLLLLIAVAACAGRIIGPPAAAARPLLILVSLDGWRWDYDTKAPAPNLRALMARGVRAEGLIPGFPSKTVPNHYSIVTGLYPGHHGMVANVIRDPETGRLFERTNRREVEDPMWWGGDPIWNTAQRAGLVAATMFWPGSEARVGGMQPRYWREFDERMPETERVAQVLTWLDQPAAERPHLLTLYLNEVDTLGHWYGPDSVRVRDAIARADGQLGALVTGLRQRGLLASANLVIVSDHGMASTTRARTIVADDYIAAADVEIADINPTLGVTPRPGREQHVLQALRSAHPNLKMYARDDTPEHWRLRGQPRVPPITGVADEGWVVVLRRNIDEYWKRSPDGGQHGYDPQLLSMRGIFVAAGPAFRADGGVVPAFDNVHVYNALAMAIGVTPSVNDGEAAVARRLLRAVVAEPRSGRPRPDGGERSEEQPGGLPPGCGSGTYLMPASALMRNPSCGVPSR